MSYRIAAASTDGKVVNQHFGKAEAFHIIEVDEAGAWQWLESRRTGAACDGGTHTEDGLARNVELLSDCAYVLVSKIGPGAERALKSKGILPFAIGSYIADAIVKIDSYHNRAARLSERRELL